MNNFDEISEADIAKTPLSECFDPALREKFNNAPGYVHGHLKTALLDQYNPGLMGCARMLEQNGFTEDEAVTIIYATPGHRAPVGNEIEKAVCVIFNTDPENDSIPWPSPSLDKIAEVKRNSPVKTVKDLQAKFPMEGDGSTLETLTRLFQSEERIAYTEFPGKSIAQSDLLKNIKSLDGMQMICPNPRSKEFGITEKKNRSRRCKENDPEQRHSIVIEFDKVHGEPLPKGTQAAVAWHLSPFAPLTLVVDSGGKSLHCWFDCRDKNEDELRAFMRYAVSLGGDSTMFTACQWSRMPGGVRVNEDGTTAPQTVLVCRPDASGADDWNLDKLPGEKVRVFPRPMSGSMMRVTYSTPPVEVIEGIAARGEKVQISGSSKAGKTWAMLNLAGAVQTGGKFLGLRCVQGNVLFLNFELSETRMRERIDMFPELANVDFINCRGINCDWEMVKSGLSDLQKSYSTIIVDPIYKMLGDRDENSNGDITDLLHHVERIASEMDAMTAYSHHHSKGNKASVDQIDRSSGAGAWGRDPDALLSLTPHEDENCMVFEATLRNYAKMKSTVWEFKFPRFIHCPEANPESLKKRGGSNKKGGPVDALQIVLQHPGGISRADLARALAVKKGVTEGTARGYITAAEDVSIEMRDKKFFVTETGEDIDLAHLM